MTTSSNDFVAEIHDRMPVILDHRDIDGWLDPEVHECERVLPLVRPCPSEGLTAYEVSMSVNSVRNKSPDVLQPLAARDDDWPTFDFERPGLTRTPNRADSEGPGTLGHMASG